ncbi:MAG: hypothetical protein K2U26_03650 [Cyclobacteriaceae bacterium]|nr:hypothetical protein [Cyclobacteriaceae bacterium]
MNTISDKVMFYRGALVPMAATFAYSILVMIYVIIRSSLTIYGSMPKGERSLILWLNGFSVAYSVMIFSLIMAMVSSLVGAVTALILKKVLLHFNPQFQWNKVLIISFTTALALLTIHYLLLRIFLNGYMTFDYPETFLFWWGFPAVIFLGVVVVGSYQFNKALLGQHLKGNSTSN